MRLKMPVLLSAEDADETVCLEAEAEAAHWSKLTLTSITFRPIIGLHWLGTREAIGWSSQMQSRTLMDIPS